ncbi:MAG: TrkA C-terminal domain-containing protein [Christensenellales bacterium]|jgi:K+/H+ antiporter YhaU regulatory subunit KhtT
MNAPELPQYQRIAYDIASRVAAGEIPVRRKMSGRSLLASEYGVSPETIRRALKLLSDMKVVAIHAGSGVYAISRDSAKRYIESRRGEEERKGLEMRFRELVSRQGDLSLEILDIASEMTRARQTTRTQMPYYEEIIAPGSTLVGKSIGTLQFWQTTGATIIGIRRGKRVILSPGPDAELYDGDSIIFVGEPDAVDLVKGLVAGGA